MLAGKLRQGACLWVRSSVHTPGPAKLPPPLRPVWSSREGRGRKGGAQSKRGLRGRPVLPHSRWRRGSGRVPQRRYQRMRSAESRPGTQDGGSGVGEGRRRRQNRQSSRTCNRVPSSPLRAGKSPGSHGPAASRARVWGSEARRRWPLRRFPLRATACPVSAAAAILGPLGGRPSRWPG